MDPVLSINNISKDFILHHQHGTRIFALTDFSRDFFPGQASVLSGPSGSGKSTLLRMIYGGYRTEKGRIIVRHGKTCVDIAAASPSMIYDIRRNTIGYVSQFLRVVPRVPAIDTVIEPLIDRGMSETRARIRGKEMLERLKIPKKLWQLSATTFSGGEQQRINLARGFIAPFPLMLLDEPTASLDAENRKTVLQIIREAIQKGSCVIGVFHSKSDWGRLTDEIVDMSQKKRETAEA